MATVTDNGIQGKTLNEYLVQLRDAHKQIDPEWDVSASSPDGQKIGTDAEMFARADEAVIAAYNSHDPASAKGQALRNIGILSGNLTPTPALPSNVPLTFTGSNGTVVLAGSAFKDNSTGERWITLDTATIAGGTATATAFSEKTGPIAASIGAITTIENPLAGLTSVTNLNAASLGRDEESEDDFRIRRLISVARPGNAQIDSMLANVRQVEGVKIAKLYENFTNITDSNGLPAHSISMVVSGGESDDIALAMYEKKNPGVDMYGDTGAITVPVTSPKTGNKMDIIFQRAELVTILVEVDVQQVGDLPNNIEDLISQAIIDYAERKLLPNNIGFNIEGFDIGESVPPSRLYTPCNKVLGPHGDSYITRLQISRSPDPAGSTPVSMVYNELAVFDLASITVTVTP